MTGDFDLFTAARALRSGLTILTKQSLGFEEIEKLQIISA